jgi:predicted dienelactone hydrolase
MRFALPMLAGILVCATTAAAGTVNVKRVVVADANDRPRDVVIWSPGEGRTLPLVVILHGNEGGPENHAHTARALADAGFVVAVVAHGPDLSFVERPRHVSRVLDYMLGAWPERERLDPARIGIYGFSVGGFTALVTLGATPDFGRIPGYCAEHQDRVCSFLTDGKIDIAIPDAAWVRDTRIRAAVIATPTLGFTFAPASLAAVKAPMQLWRAARDEITPHPRHTEAVYQALPVKPDYHVVPNAGHFAFVGCSGETAKRAPAVCRDAADFDREVFHRTFNASVVAFFKARLASR